jgi:hypothetical protein
MPALERFATLYTLKEPLQRLCTHSQERQNISRLPCTDKECFSAFFLNVHNRSRNKARGAI